MKKNIRLITTALVLCVTAGTADAGKMFGRGEGRNVHDKCGSHEAFVSRLIFDKKLAEQIGLSEDQSRHIRDELYRVRMEMVDLQADLQKAAIEQARLLSADTIDEQALMTVIEKIGNVRTQIAKLRIKPLLVIKKTLDPEQLEKVRERMKEHYKARRTGIKKRFKEQRRRWKGSRGRGRRNPDPEEDGIRKSGADKMTDDTEE